MIGLSGRGKRLDKILFTLLHETAHLTLGHVNPDEIIVEEVEQHASDSACEKAANKRAGSWILPQPTCDKPHCSSPKAIVSFEQPVLANLTRKPEASPWS